MKITANQLRELAKSAPIFADYFNAAADEIERQNETLSVVADIAVSRNDGELFKVVASYQDEAFINKIKADAILEAASTLVSGDDFGNPMIHMDDVINYAEKIRTEGSRNSLKPCPFCGGEPEIKDHRLVFSVSCDKCSLTVVGDHAPEPESESDCENIDWNNYKQTAVDRWNNRPHEDKIKENAIRDYEKEMNTGYMYGDVLSDNEFMSDNCLKWMELFDGVTTNDNCNDVDVEKIREAIEGLRAANLPQPESSFGILKHSIESIARCKP